MTSQFATALSIALPIIGVGAGAIAQYIASRKIELRKHSSLKKSEAYSNYIKGFSLLAKTGTANENLYVLLEAKSQICIYGSQHIVRCLGEFEKLGARFMNETQVLAMIKLLNAMRADLQLGGKHVAEADIKSVLFLKNDQEQ